MPYRHCHIRFQYPVRNKKKTIKQSDRNNKEATFNVCKYLSLLLRNLELKTYRNL